MKTIISILIITLFLFIPFHSGAEFPGINQSSSISLSPTSLFEPTTEFNLPHADPSEHTTSSSTQQKQMREQIFLTLEDITLSLTKQNTTVLTLSDSIPFNQPDFPLLPMRTVTVHLEKDVLISDVRYEGYEVVYCQKPLSFPTTPLPFYWSVNKTPLHNHTTEIIKETQEI
jgi:hypothetical protein